MNVERARIDEPWSRFLAGGTLSPEEERELAEALSGDEALRADLLQDKRLHGALRGMGRTRTGDEAFTQAVRTRLRVEKDAAPFVERVREQVRRQGGRSRRARVAGPGRSFRRVWMIAAAVLFAAAVGFLLLPEQEKPHPSVIRGVDPVPPEPPTPVVKRPVAKPIHETAPPERMPARPGKPGPTIERSHAKRPNFPEPDFPEASRPTPKPAPPEAPKRPAPSKAAPLPPTRVIVATVEELDGAAALLTVDGERAVRVGTAVADRDGLRTEIGGRAVLRYADGTRLVVGAESLVERVHLERDPAGVGRGKRVKLALGTLRADVTPQPRGKPMVFLTPHGEATVLGTTLRLLVDPDPKKGSTRLEVWNGKVHLRRSDGRALTVMAGHTAVAAPGKSLSRSRFVGPNLLQDPGFEAGGKIWNTFDPRGDQIVRNPHTGGLAQEVTSGAGIAENEVYQDVRVAPGVAYWARAWVKCDDVQGGGEVRVFINWHDSAGTLIQADSNLGRFRKKRDWTFVAGRFTAPAGATTARFYLHVGGTAKAWFDDVYLAVTR